MVDLLLYNFLFIICGSIFAIQVAEESVLSLKLKQLLLLNQPYNSKLSIFKDLRTWHKILKTGLFSLFFVLILPVWILINLHYFIAELVDCSKCTAFWIGVAINYFVIGTSITNAFLLAPLFILGVLLIKKFL